MKSLFLHCLFFLCLAMTCLAQTFSVKGKLTNAENGEGISHATVQLKGTRFSTMADEHGHFELTDIPPGAFTVTAYAVGYQSAIKEIILVDKDIKIHLHLQVEAFTTDSVTVSGQEKTFGLTRLKDVEGTSIYAGKKSEVIVLKDLTANTATNNSRQIYAKIAGLNIWESDGYGIQLGIGGRGLSPQRTTNFNTRQNGYDISADALGYPESYYSPPTEAVDRIEIVRGAASLQYGTQFGGMVNFKLKTGPDDRKIQLTARQTAGSWGFFNTFNSVGGTVGKVNYYGFYQHKQGNGWRPNSEFEVNTAYGAVTYKANTRLSVTVQYTHMDYWAHQPGGLTDAEFKQNPRQSIRTRNWFKVNWNLGAVLLDYNISARWKFNTRFFGLLASRSALGNLTYINRVDDLGSPRNLWTDQYTNWGNETRLLYHYRLGSRACVFLVGFRYYHGHTDRRQGLGNNGTGGTRQDFTFSQPDSLAFSEYTFPNHNTSIFIENIFKLTQKWNLVPGLRFENIQTKANGFYHIVNQDLAGNVVLQQPIVEHRVNTRSFVIAGIGTSYDLHETMQWYANISQNYRAINFNDMRVVNQNMKVDPNLKDEKGYSADLGTRGTVAGIFRYDFSLFLIHYANKIGTVSTVDSLTYNIYNLRTNVSESRNYGLESFVEVDIWRLLRGDSVKTSLLVFSNFSWLDARYVNSKITAYNNKKVELVPNVIFKGGISVKRDKWSATFQYSYTGSQYTDATNSDYTANAINGLVPAYYVMDLSTQYTFTKYLQLSFSLNNISNHYYFTRRADSYPGPGIIPSDARSFYLTLQVKL